MKVRVKAPLRLGLAGGGTDVSPYSDIYGGCVLNATINMYAHAFIELNDNQNSNTIEFEAKDINVKETIHFDEFNDYDSKLSLHYHVYKRIINDFNDGKLISLKIVTFSDAPPGSGLGSSSTMVVAILEGLRQLLSLPLGEYDIAHLAYEIERIDCKLSGGKQDQYAATFGGFNFMEFHKNDQVIVNPLRIRRYIVNELESSLLLYFTGASRSSAKIIDEQIKSIGENDKLNSMHEVKRSSFVIKEKLFKADIAGIAQEFKSAWEAKKNTSSSITNEFIDDIEEAVLSAGALSVKVSGAGGGGFMMIFIKPEDRLNIEAALNDFEGNIKPFEFTNEGVVSWTI